MSEDTPIYSEPRKPGLFRRLWRFIKTTFVVLVILIALSYLPASLLGDPDSRLRQAHDITLDIRALTYGLTFDAATALHAGVQGLYQSYGEQLPPAITDWLDPWLAEDAAEPMPASSPTAQPASAPEPMSTESAAPEAAPETDANSDTNPGTNQ